VIIRGSDRMVNRPHILGLARTAKPTGGAQLAHKLEARNPKSETNSKFKSSNRTAYVTCFLFGIFGFRICFGFRASDFEFVGKAGGAPWVGANYRRPHLLSLS
jgi:hypothetical protein